MRLLAMLVMCAAVVGSAQTGASTPTKKPPRVCIEAVRDARRALDLEIAAFGDITNLTT